MAAPSTVADCIRASLRAPTAGTNVEVSRSDDRAYRYLALPNGLRVLCVSDPSTDMAAAALQVSVGSFSDGEFEGLAHFLEHLSFLGTESYPDENSFSAFLNEHGGNSNAYTASEATNYQFDIAASSGKLREALARFASFFSCPLFTESATGRELNAVDSEHQKNLQSDGWRAYQLDKSTSNAAHPYSRFGTGDSRTLRDEPAARGADVRKAVLKLHADHYSAGRMTLAVLGSEPVETLAQWASELFAPIRNNGSAPPAFGGHPHSGRQALLQLSVPVKDLRHLVVAWALPEIKSDWRAKSASYASHLLGHEGPGSLLSLLKAHGWAEGLHSGVGADESGFATFNVTVELSEAGLARAEDVHACIYAYVGMMRAHGPQEWVWSEMAVQAATSFRFQSKYSPVGYTTSLASQLSEPLAVAHPEKVLTGESLFFEYNAASVRAVLEHFTPANSRVLLSAKAPAVAERCTLREKVYGTAYFEEPLAPALQERIAAVAAAYEKVTAERIALLGGRPATGGAAWRGEAAAAAPPPAAPPAAAAVVAQAFAAALSPPLTLPAPNAFLATDFAIRDEKLAARKAAEESSAAAAAAAAAEGAPHSTIGGVRVRREPAPRLLRRDARCEAFFLTDDFFGVPKLSVYVQLRLPASAASARGACLLDLYVRLLVEELNEYTYAADCAGLRFNASTLSNAAQITFGGFAHKMPVLVARVAEKAARLAFSDVVFEVQRDRLVRAYENAKKDQPYSHAVTRAMIAAVTPCWSTEEKLRAAAGLDAAAMRAALPDFLRHVFARVLVSGNATEAEAAAVVAALTAPFEAVSAAPPASLLAGTRVLQLPAPLAVRAGAGGGESRVSLELVYALPARNAADANAAMSYLLQVGPAARGAACGQRALLELAAHLLGEPYFNVLRTQQQLGYVVQAGTSQLFNVDHLRFLVQSDKVPAAELVARTDAFLASFAAGVEAMPEEKFAANVRAVAARCAEADKNLSAEAERLWGEVRSCSLDFARASNEVRALLALTRAEVAAWFRDHVAPGGAQRRVLIALIEGGTAAAKRTEGGAAAGAGAGATAAEAEATDGSGDDDEGDEDEDGEDEAPKADGAAAAAAAAPAELDASLPVVPPVPVVDATFAQCGAVLQSLAAAGPVTPATAAAAFAAAGLSDALAPHLAAGAPAVRVRVAVPRDDDAPALVHAMLPAYPDMAYLYSTLNALA